MIQIAIGILLWAAAFLFWRWPAPFEWLDDQTNMRGVRMWERLGYKGDPGEEFHRQRRRALRRALIVFFPVLELGFVLGGIAAI